MASRGIAILMMMLTCITFTVHANTEIVKFTAGQSIFADQHEKEAFMQRIRAPATFIDPETWPRVASPYTLIRNEALQPSYSRGEDLAQRLKEDATLHEDHWTNREVKWYVLDQLENGAGYELRVSYPSTSPADFELKVWTLIEAQEYFGRDKESGILHLVAQFPEKTMFASIKAIYTGVSYQHGPEAQSIPYNLVMEKLYFMVVPYQALKLALAIALAVVVGFAVLIPKIHRYLIHVAATGTEPETPSSSKDKRD